MIHANLKDYNAFYDMNDIKFNYSQEKKTLYVQQRKDSGTWPCIEVYISSNEVQEIKVIHIHTITYVRHIPILIGFASVS